MNSVKITARIFCTPRQPRRALPITACALLAAEHRHECFQENQMKRLALLCLIILCASIAFGVPPITLPSVSVSGVTATSPVLRSTAGIAVSATVASTFDSNSSTPSTNYASCNNGNNYCGTNNSTVKSQKVVTTTAITVTDQTTNVSAADPYNSTTLTGSGTAYSGTLTTPTVGTDGFTTVTVTANVSESVTTCTTTDTSYWTAANGGGTQVGTTTTVGPTCGAGVPKTGTGSGTATYVLDINAPILTLQPDIAQPSVMQGGDKNVHNVLIGGSAGTSYTLTDTVTSSDNTYSNTANGTGTFGPGSDGIAPNEHSLVAVHIACDAPVGDYNATAVANTVDLGLIPFDQISSIDYAGPPAGGATDTFTVTPGVALEDQTAVVAELPPSGDYAPMSCFTAATSGRKVTTFPGSLHITAVVNTTGPCAGFATISGAVVTLTLPSGFSFDTTGNSPAAHVFIVNAANGFDYHYPGPEIALPKSAITGASTQVLTVNLSSVNLGQGVGVIPSSDTIYVRAHAVFSGGSVPADGTPYVFTTGTSATLTGVGPSTAQSSQTVTKSSACVNGN
jgi:hypothetical protein